MTHPPAAHVQLSPTRRQRLAALAHEEQTAERDALSRARRLYQEYRAALSDGLSLPQFLAECKAAGLAESTARDRVSACLAADAGIVVPEGQRPLSILVAAQARITRHLDKGLTASAAVEAAQTEVNDGTARIRAAVRRGAPEGITRVDLPDVVRPTEEQLHAELRELAVARRQDLPAGAPEIRGLLVERFAGLPQDLRALILWPDAQEIVVVPRRQLEDMMQELAALRPPA
ncbi:hypothetical protein [Deinococcus arenicola]|uniref:DUF222 domain-containing protein n=1 Tax=Deinococcus arenicola TaxID=2994950 RepID=A0ABU4DVG1_9DEIO|nr:hypothetical protein [Deinococcus sp. ZS9-10]MDV6376431.1 hypothetical protein [Deinococcus sp. ZS9-10]